MKLCAFVVFTGTEGESRWKGRHGKIQDKIILHSAQVKQIK